MRITIIGARGSVGCHLVSEAATRGHEVTAAVRDPARALRLPPGVRTRAGDATDVERVTELGAGQDVVISATRPRPGAEHELAAVATSLLSGVTMADTRLILIGGAATLTIPGTDRKVVDDPELPTAWRPIARACVEQLAACRSAPVADWTYVSPPALLEPGPRTGHYRLGRDELVVNADGRSAISIADFAVAVVDEAERPRHRRMRFTVGY